MSPQSTEKRIVRAGDAADKEGGDAGVRTSVKVVLLGVR